MKKLFENIGGNNFKLNEADWDVKDFDTSDQIENRKEDHDETDMNNPEENREVKIGKKILDISSKYGIRTSVDDLPEECSKLGFDAISELAQELIQIHQK